ncbi:hypothetical protein AWR38_06170 [Idiomarina sp. WRN-38]|nr:hypothetical protein AUR68_06155 [Idiomarina sp. H105]OAE91002.1 hypothetical protein AWR38_06170 [Idiomarina sp. WRN-38]
MKNVQKEIYYVVFTDKATGLIGAKNYVDYETAVERAILTRQHERYDDVYVTRVIDVEMPHSAL